MDKTYSWGPELRDWNGLVKDQGNVDRGVWIFGIGRQVYVHLSGLRLHALRLSNTKGNLWKAIYVVDVGK